MATDQIAQIEMMNLHATIGFFQGVADNVIAVSSPMARSGRIDLREKPTWFFDIQMPD
jgi:hypothetical protein